MQDCLRARMSWATLALMVTLASSEAVLAQPNPPPAASAPDATADDLLARFRRGWTAGGDHMRPLDDRGWMVRMEVLRGLVSLGDEAVEPLIKALDDTNDEVRVLAAQALAYLGDPRSADRLEQTLAEDDAPAARLYAADALGAIGGLEPSPLLDRVAAEDENRDVQAHVRFALERNGKPLNDEIRERLRSFDLDRMNSARVGEVAPDFTLIDALGKGYRLSDFRGNQAVVLLFIYGDT